MDAYAARRSYRAVFISDIHLGARGCQAERLLAFLEGLDCATLYLVGDIVDGWRLSRRWRWPPSHDAVVARLLALARGGVRVVYLPGNHDAFARAYAGSHLAGVVVAPEAVHVAADGRRYLVTHGDLYDGLEARPRWMTALGDAAYRGLMRLDGAVGAARRGLGLGYWSLAGWVKGGCKEAGGFVERYEHALAAEARRRGLDGVVCGHIHKARARDIAGVAYVNDGDWVESCTAAAEGFDGRMEVLSLTGLPAALPASRRADGWGAGVDAGAEPVPA